MRLQLGLLRFNLAKTYKHGNSLWFQQHIPPDLTDRYPVRIRKHNLKTLDPIKAAPLAEALDQKYAAEFAALRADPAASPQAMNAHAVAFLRGFGVIPGSQGNDPDAIARLHEYIDGKREGHAAGDEEVYRTADGSEYLTPVELAAGRLLFAPSKDTLEDVLEVYLGAHDKRAEPAFVKYQRAAFADLLAVTGNKEVNNFKREDAHAYVDAALRRGNKTGTVRRRLNLFAAAWNEFLRERNRVGANPFSSLSIPGEGTDRKERLPFTDADLLKLWAECRAADDDMRWLLALQIDTGTRIAEPAGLLLSDLHVDAPIPYVVYQPHPWRSIKGSTPTKKNKRSVPLVGAALWAAQRVCESAQPGQRFAFPRYTSEARCKATNASNALNAWIRGLGLEYTTHSLRHTLKDRLRHVGCPKDVRDVIQGHSSQDVGEGYGEGHNLPTKRDWLLKVCLTV